ncbi:MAG: hypothetical protein BWZ10_00229 [candidate division BRC1 bacterium ADurb.BinA364]|nr:MAG: hypothetical protein BWZ10_00229 [candidate division BRC1 bacterium ADurb.BinA364]
MRDVAPLARFAQAVALDRHRQDAGRRAFVLHGGVVGGIDFFRIVAAAAHFADLLVGQMLGEFAQFGRIEKMLAGVGAGFDRVFLQLAVDDFVHALDQRAVAVLVQQGVPVAAPDDFDHIPAGAAERRFELLDDLAVAAHGAVEALQIAVDHEDQVVEPLARGQRDRAERFRLVALAVAQKGPDLAFGGVAQPAMLEVAVESRLINRRDRPQAHRNGRKLPEIGHQPGMRIRGQAARRLRFAAEIFQLLGLETAFEISAGIDAGRGMPLEKNLVAGE